MSVKAKRLVNSYEERMLEFLHTCVDNNYRTHLGSIHLPHLPTV